MGKVDFDDDIWEDVNPCKAIHDLPQIRQQPVGWFRIKLHFDSSLWHKPLAFYVYQSIASEIYLNGKLLHKYGIVSQNLDEIKAIQPLNAPIGFIVDKSEQVFAVRFSVQPNLYYSSYFKTFEMRINDVWGAGQFDRMKQYNPALNGLTAGIFLILSLIHFVFFLIEKKTKGKSVFFVGNFIWCISAFCASKLCRKSRRKL